MCNITNRGATRDRVTWPSQKFGSMDPKATSNQTRVNLMPTPYLKTQQFWHGIHDAATLKISDRTCKYVIMSSKKMPVSEIFFGTVHHSSNHFIQQKQKESQ